MKFTKQIDLELLAGMQRRLTKATRMRQRSTGIKSRSVLILLAQDLICWLKI